MIGSWTRKLQYNTRCCCARRQLRTTERQRLVSSSVILSALNTVLCHLELTFVGLLTVYVRFFLKLLLVSAQSWTLAWSPLLTGRLCFCQKVAACGITSPASVRGFRDVSLSSLTVASYVLRGSARSCSLCRTCLLHRQPSRSSFCTTLMFFSLLTHSLCAL